VRRALMRLTPTRPQPQLTGSRGTVSHSACRHHPGGRRPCDITTRIRQPAPAHPRIASIQVGQTKPLQTASGVVSSAFVKSPVQGPVRLSLLGLAGDEHGDRDNHGGRDQALCAYPAEHYQYWSERLSRELGPASFGENLTTEGLLEDELEIGATFAVGDAVIQVSQPRAPCFKLAGRHDLKRLPLWVRQTGRTGFYFRVLRDGVIAPGAELARLDSPATGLTITELNRVSYLDRHDISGLERAIEVEQLSPAWRVALQRLHARAVRAPRHEPAASRRT
jgi:MOSC domain-containing protein YiiM